MSRAVIVSAARTPLAKSHRGSFNRTHGATLGAVAAAAAVERAGIDPGTLEDSLWGCGYPEYVTGGNIARQIVVRAGLPVTVAGATVNRFCSSGLQAIAMGANTVLNEGAKAVLVGGVESISMVQPVPRGSAEDWIVENKPELYLPMIDTADIVAERYGVSREAQDELSLQSQQRTAAAQEAGRMDAELVPVTTVMAVKDKATGEESEKEVTVTMDECNRPSTTLEGLAKLEPVKGAGKYVTAGNASQLSDGAAALVMMDEAEAERLGLEPLGAFRAFAVAGCEPDEMGIGPVFAVPRLLERQGFVRRRHRPVGAQRGVREPGAALPRHARDRSGRLQRRRRLDLDRPPVRHDGRAHDRAPADRGAQTRGEARRRDDVHRRRAGRGRAVRDLLSPVSRGQAFARDTFP